MQHSYGHGGHPHSHGGHPHSQGRSPVEVDMEKMKEQFKRLKNENSTMVLATKASNGQAEVSYAPYIYFRDKYYLILSQVAGHYDNVTGSKDFQGMIIESEQSAVSTFFRKRIIFNFVNEKINQEDEVVEQFTLKHGALVKTALMMDFSIFELKLVKGRMIVGPGQAFRFDENENLLEQITSK